MIYLVQNVMSGLITGGAYALLALGFVIVYKTSGVLNFAVGELLFLMSVTIWLLLVPLGLPPWVAIIFALAIGGIFGFLIEWSIMRPLMGQPLFAMIVATLGLASLCSGIAGGLTGGTMQSYPHIFPTGTVSIGEINLSIEASLIFGIAVILIIGFYLFFQYAGLGLEMRAIADGHNIARSLGLNVSKSMAVAWAIGIAMCTIGGFLLAVVCGVDANLATMGLKVFPVVLLGGLESVPGAIVGGLIIGVAEALASAYLDPYVGGGMREVFPFVVLLIVLMIRPYGLFGLKRIERI